jgi:CubicO group peptidase (beta-lactamase class C family)
MFRSLRNSLLTAAHFWVVAFAADAPDARIARVESGLLPPARIAGTKSPPWTIAARLKEHNVPGVSLAVLDRGELAWARAYGLARAGDTAPTTTETTFSAGAIGEAVVAATLLSLVDAGRLSLDTPLAAAPPPATADTPRPTLRQLLSHSAGLAPNAPVRAEAAPGSRWRSSPPGYELARTLAAATAGEPFPDFARSRVLAPAGMSASRFDAAANFVTTPTDLAKFALTLRAALDGQPSFLARTTATAMITPPLADSGYGLGLGVTGEGDLLQLAHSGTAKGLRGDFIFYPRTGRGAVVMANADTAGPLINEILRALAVEYDWPHHRIVEKTTVPLDRAAFDALVGRYEREDVLAAVFRDGDRFYFQTRGTRRREIFPASELTFFLLDDPATLTFELDRRGNAIALIRDTQPKQIFMRVR